MTFDKSVVATSSKVQNSVHFQDWFSLFSSMSIIVVWIFQQGNKAPSHCWKWVLLLPLTLDRSECSFFFFLCMQGYTRLGTESLASTIYSLLCPLNISFRPSPLRFSEHTWFFILNSPHITEIPLQKFCKIGLQNRHRSFMLMIFKGNNVALLKPEVFHNLFAILQIFHILILTLNGIKTSLTYKLY